MGILLVNAGCGMISDNVKQLASPGSSDGSLTYNGVRHVQAYGDAPTAPSGTPSSRRVSLSWAAFTGAISSTKYRVLRVSTGGTFNEAASTTCTNVTVLTCVACTTAGGGARSCTDLNVATSPAQYDYLVVPLDSSNNVIVPVPDINSRRIKVAIPPDNMVLVQRDSVNSEMCELMGRASDPLNNNRCVYGGLGAVPYNTSPGKAPLNLASGYYDFGYNLFIDRWEAACNWTTQAAGGLCGAGGTAGNCFGNAAPGAALGSVGQVYYRLSYGQCYVKTGAGWLDANSSTLSNVGNISYRANLVTIAPDATNLRPPIATIFASRAKDTCSQISDANYGTKRLMRMREFVAAAAWAYRDDDVNYKSESTIATMENGSDHVTLRSCNTNTHSGVAVAASFLTAGNEISRDTSSNGLASWQKADSFVIGSNATKGCMSRTGAQDLIGNVVEQFSDETNSCGTGTSCAGATSTLDSGNSDLVGYTFDGVTGPGPTLTSGTFSSGYGGTTHVSVPLAMPYVTGASGFVVAITDAILSVQLRSDRFGLWSAGALRRLGFMMGGSFATGGTGAGRFYWETLTATGGNEDSSYGFRCAVPVE